jgi:hypothetical protein
MDTTNLNTLKASNLKKDSSAGNSSAFSAAVLGILRVIPFEGAAGSRQVKIFTGR